MRTETQPLLQHRSKVVARSFYRQLRSEGFTHEQVIELATQLLDLVATALRDKPAEAR